jgi:SAM-dependent methyltransferase
VDEQMAKIPGAPASASYPVLFAGVFVVAFGTLLFELSLIRILSFTIWHHFSYVVISTALLGFGASGSFLAVRPSFGAGNLLSTLASCAAMSAVTVTCVIGFVSVVPLHPMSILDEAGQAARLVAYQIAAAVPFFFSGLLVSLILRTGADRVDRLYFWDLLGAGLGCAAAVGLMNLLTPPGAAIVSAVAFAAASALFATSVRWRRAGVALVGALAVACSFAEEISFTPARTKELSIQRNYMGFRPYFTRWTALFRTDVVEDVTSGESGPTSRKRWAPGLSRVAPEGMERPSFFIAHDGTAGTGIFDLREGHELRHLDYHVISLPYLVANAKPRVLVIGVGGGRDMITAIRYGASHVTGAELDPVTVDLVRHKMEVSNGFFRRPDVELMASEGRHFIRSTDDRFDLIQITGVDTLSAMNTGAYVLAENYLYTIEAVHDYLDHLRPGGILSFAMASPSPEEPLSAGRMVLIAQQVLRERGIRRPWKHIAVVDSRALYAEVMIRNRPYEPAEVEQLAERAAELKFLPLLLPGRGGHPVFLKLASLTGRDREQMLSTLRFLITPTTDDRPFFQRYFRWSDLFQPGRVTPNDASALGQIVLAILLISLSVLAAAFILAPLLAFNRRGIAGGGAARIGVMLFFVAIGLGFMLFEISLIQRFVLFLGHPTYSLSVTLGSLLIALGCGSYVSRRWIGRERIALPLGVLGIAALTLFYMKGLPVVQGWFLGSHILVRAAVTAAMLAPLGLIMGMFFPLGIRRASSIHRDLVPWAWGINGCASVTGGVLTVALAMSLGFTAVWLLSLAIYAFGAAAILVTTPAPTQTP